MIFSKLDTLIFGYVLRENAHNTIDFPLKYANI